MNSEMLASALQNAANYKDTSYDERSKKRQTEFLPLCTKIFAIKGITTAITEDGRQVLKTKPVKVKTDRETIGVWMQWSYSPDANTVVYSRKEYKFGPYVPEFSLKVDSDGATIDYFSTSEHIHNAEEEPASNEEFREYIEILNSLYDYYAEESQKPRRSKQANSNQEKLTQVLRNGIVRAKRHYSEELFEEENKLEEQFRQIFEIEGATQNSTSLGSSESGREFKSEDSVPVSLTVGEQPITVWAETISGSVVGPYYGLKFRRNGEAVDYFSVNYASILTANGNRANLVEMREFNSILTALMNYYSNPSKE